MRVTVTRSLLGVVAAALVGCGAAPKGPVAGPPTAPASAPGPAPGAAPVPRPAQESLVEHLPAAAVAAVIVRHGALGLPRSILAGAPAMQRELSAYLTSELGLDPTTVDGAVAWTSNAAARSGAVFLRLRHAGTLRGRRAGQHRGVDLVEVDQTIVAASVPGGVVVGMPTEVALAIDLAAGQADRLGSSAPLGFLLAPAAQRADLCAAAYLPSVVDPGNASMVQAVGAQAVLLSYDHDGLITARVFGDPERLGAARELLRTGLGVALAALERTKDKAVRAHNVVEAAGAIIGYHQAQKLYLEIEPRIEGRALVSRYRLPQVGMQEAFLFYAGVAAAIAIPSFVKYVRRSKATEARVNVKRIADGARAFREAHLKAGRRFAFPATTPWTPATGCCARGGKCTADAAAWSHPSWQALGFALAEPHFYQYRFVSEGKGKQARFTALARGDLDCNGTSSSFRARGHLAPDGSLVVEPLDVAHETE